MRAVGTGDFLGATGNMVTRPEEVTAPHLPVRVRDGTGLVGPLVIPGETSCLSITKWDAYG